jgi:hypothetical protein
VSTNGTVWPFFTLNLLTVFSPLPRLFTGVRSTTMSGPEMARMPPLIAVTHGIERP